MTKDIVGGTSVPVAETAGTGTNLDHYTSVLACTSNGSPVPNGSGATSATFTMPDAPVSCTVTNTRKSNTVTLTKACEPANDGGTFNLTINGTTESKRCNESTQKAIVGNTSVTISEAGGNGTNLADYVISWSCTGGITFTGQTSTSRTFVMPDTAVTCTVTNKRPSISVTKACTAGLTAQGLQVTVSSSGKICNEGSLPVTIGAVSDVQIGGSASAGTISPSTLAGTILQPKGTAGDCVDFTSTLTPTQASSGACSGASCNVGFTDKVTVNASASGVNLVAEQTAVCSLCK